MEVPRTEVFGFKNKTRGISEYWMFIVKIGEVVDESQSYYLTGWRWGEREKEGGREERETDDFYLLSIVSGHCSFWITVVTHGILTSQSGKLRLLTLNYFATALMGEFTYFKWCTAKPHLSSVLLITSSFTRNLSGGTWRKLEAPTLQQSSAIHQMEGVICSAQRSWGSKWH